MNTIFEFGPFELVLGQNLLLKNGEKCPVNGRAYDVLVALVERAGQLVTNRELIARAWPTVVVEEANLRIQVASLRRVLGDSAADPSYILNVPGRGYRLIAKVSSRDTDAWVPKLRPKDPEPWSGSPKVELPLLLNELVGRDKAIDTLADQFLRQRFVTIVGAGGIGKTTLAVATAWRIAERYPDGVFFVSFASLRSSDLVIGCVASALHIEATTSATIDRILQFLRGKNVLLLFDNCEHVIDEAAMLAEALLKGVSSVHILATSREPLRAEGERLRRLTPLEFPELTQSTLTVEDAASFSAIQLFVDRAAASLDTFQLSDGNSSAVADICRRLDGIPLALELAAARINQFSVETLLQRLKQRMEELPQGRRTAPPRHQTLRATLDWSFGILLPLEQTVLICLAIFNASFTLEMALFVLLEKGLQANVVEGVIESLVAKSLVFNEINLNRTYYRILQTTRTYLQEKLQGDAEFPTLARRHATFFCEDLAKNRTSETETTLSVRWGHYSRWIDDIRFALAWAFSSAGDRSIGASLAVSSAPVWLELSLVNEYEHHISAALGAFASNASSDVRPEMELNTKAGLILFNLVGPGPRFVLALHRALILAEKIGDIRCQLTALWGLWGERHCAAEYEDMRALAMRFDKAAAQSDDKHAAAMSDRLMALALCRQGKLMLARQQGERSLSRSNASIDSALDSHFYYSHLSASSANLACTLWLQGELVQAMALLADACDRALAANDSVTLCYVLSHVACPMVLWAGDHTLAGRYIGLLSEHSKKNGFSYFLAWAKCYSYVLTKKDELAAGNSVESLSAEYRRWSQENRGLLFPLQIQLLATIDAEFVDAAAIERASGHDPDWAAAEILRVAAERLMDNGAYDTLTVEDLLDRSAKIARQQGCKAWELRAAISRARLWSSSGREEQVAPMLASVRDSFEPGQRSVDLAIADSLLGSSPSRARRSPSDR
jgi:predicted ATPase/DNA-binding winged helix-turn-helix (wHTH) protein